MFYLEKSIEEHLLHYLSTFVDDTYLLATVCFLLHMSTVQILPEKKSMLK